jgi:hypothetical protein
VGREQGTTLCLHLLPLGAFRLVRLKRQRTVLRASDYDILAELGLRTLEAPRMRKALNQREETIPDKIPY